MPSNLPFALIFVATFAVQSPAGALVSLKIASVYPADTPIAFDALFKPEPVPWPTVPSASKGPLVVTVVDLAKGTSIELAPGNMLVNRNGSNKVRVDLWSQQSVRTAPEAIDPLPSGEYLLRVHQSGEPGGVEAKLHVRDDPQAKEKFTRDILAQAARGDPFAQYIAFTYSIDPDATHRVKLLLADPQTASQVAFELQDVRRFPEGGEKILIEAMRRYAVRDRSQLEQGLVRCLALTAGNLGTDDALEAVLVLARAPGNKVPAVEVLDRFKQDRALDQLVEFANGQMVLVSDLAISKLIKARNPRVIAPLARRLASDPVEANRRGFAECLGLFLDDPAAHAALEAAAASDPAESVRSAAKKRLETGPY